MTFVKLTLEQNSSMLDTETMSVIPQILIAILIWLIIMGSFVNPDLRTYSTQLIALLLVFYIILQHVQSYMKKKEIKNAARGEDTVLFLSTYVKPKLEECCEDVSRSENRPMVEKKLEIVINEIENFLKDEEKEI